MVAVLGLAFLLLAGLVIDSSRQLNARGRALAYAEEAARAGTTAADPGDRDLALDPGAAAARVAAYCADAMAADASLVECELVGVDGTTVNTRTRTEVVASLLGIIGVHQLGGEGEGSARPLVGTTGDDAN
jgi:Flp pilus assembly protein TadG